MLHGFVGDLFRVLMILYWKAILFLPSVLITHFSICYCCVVSFEGVARRYLRARK